MTEGIFYSDHQFTIIPARDYDIFAATPTVTEVCFYAKSARIIAPATSLRDSHLCLCPCEIPHRCGGKHQRRSYFV
ncbi:MAG: hypothetical protein DWI29_00770 [Planctomycetota bacterium]|nr:MAG: hypothetical protein DWI29_00770 [Planctomycetota bacterium]